MSASVLMVRQDEGVAPMAAESNNLAEAADLAVREVNQAGAERAERSAGIRDIMSDIHGKFESYEVTIEAQRSDLERANDKYAELYNDYVVSQAENVRSSEAQRKAHEEEMAATREAHARELADLRASHEASVESIKAAAASASETQRIQWVEALEKFKARVEEALGLERAENARVNGENVRLCEENQELSRSVERLVAAIRQNVASMRKEDESLGRAIEVICGRPAAEVIPFVQPASKG